VGLIAALDSPPPVEQVHDQENKREHEQEMNACTRDVEHYDRTNPREKQQEP
jgi:hypothetical protein